MFGVVIIVIVEFFGWWVKGSGACLLVVFVCSCCVRNFLDYHQKNIPKQIKTQ